MNIRIKSFLQVDRRPLYIYILLCGVTAMDGSQLIGFN